MAQPRDITPELGKLRKRNLQTPRPPLPASRMPLERKPAFDAVGFLFWTLVCLFLFLQVAFLVWLLQSSR